MNIPSKSHFKKNMSFEPFHAFFGSTSHVPLRLHAASRQGHHGTATTRTFSMEVGQKGSSHLIRKPQERLVFVYHMRTYIYIYIYICNMRMFIYISINLVVYLFYLFIYLFMSVRLMVYGFVLLLLFVPVKLLSLLI